MKDYIDTHDNGNFVWAVITENSNSSLNVIGIFDKYSEEQAKASAAQYGIQAYVLRYNLNHMVGQAV